MLRGEKKRKRGRRKWSRMDEGKNNENRRIETEIPQQS